MPARHLHTFRYTNECQQDNYTPTGKSTYAPPWQLPHLAHKTHVVLECAAVALKLPHLVSGLRDTEDLHARLQLLGAAPEVLHRLQTTPKFGLPAWAGRSARSWNAGSGGSQHPELGCTIRQVAAPRVGVQDQAGSSTWELGCMIRQVAAPRVGVQDQAGSSIWSWLELGKHGVAHTASHPRSCSPR